MFNNNQRLMPMIAAELEWKYLVNETFIGEKCIVPLLNQVLNSEIIKSSSLKDRIEQQLAEEINHVRIYYKLVGADRLDGSQYDIALSEIVSNIESPTLKLFALQGMLEGIALGALEYRRLHWNDSPSAKSDMQVKKDEENHTIISYPFFSDLIKYEGIIKESSFREVSKDVNKVFIESFSGNSLKKFVTKCNVHTSWTTEDFENTNSMSEFKRQSAKIISKNRKSFLDCYQKAVFDA